MVKNDYSLAASDEHSKRNIKPDEGKGNVSFRDNSSRLFRIVYKMMYHIFGRVSNVDHRAVEIPCPTCPTGTFPFRTS